METWHWLDWLGLSLAAYGLTAGFVRGFSPQFTRFLVWVAAFVLLALVNFLLQGIADFFANGSPQAATLLLSLELAFLFLSVLLLGVLRRLLFSWLRAGGGLGDRILGSAFGFVVSAFLWTVLFSAQREIMASEETSPISAPVYEVLTVPFRWIPDGLIPTLLQQKNRPSLE